AQPRGQYGRRVPDRSAVVVILVIVVVAAAADDCFHQVGIAFALDGRRRGGAGELEGRGLRVDPRGNEREHQPRQSRGGGAAGRSTRPVFGFAFDRRPACSNCLAANEPEQDPCHGEVLLPLLAWILLP